MPDSMWLDREINFTQKSAKVTVANINYRIKFQSSGIWRRLNCICDHSSETWNNKKKKMNKFQE